MAIRDGLIRGFCGLGLVLLAGCTASDPVCKPTPIALMQVHFFHNEPVFDATMNGKAVPMMFDTGSEISVITPQTVARLHIPRLHSRFMTLIGPGGSVRTSEAFVKQFQMGVAVGVGFKFPVVTLADRHTGLARIGGAIGEDVFHNYDVDIDFPHRQAFLISSRHCQVVIPWNGALHPVHFRIAHDGAAEFPITMNGHRVEAIFDTGSSGNLGSSGTLMNRSLFNDLGLNSDHPQKIREAHGLGIGGYGFHVAVYRLHDAEIGGVVWRHPIVGVGGDSGEMGSVVIVGESFIRHHEIYISYPRRTLYVRAATP